MKGSEARILANVCSGFENCGLLYTASLGSGGRRSKNSAYQAGPDKQASDTAEGLSSRALPSVLLPALPARDDGDNLPERAGRLHRGASVPAHHSASPCLTPGARDKGTLASLA